jgi:hypothetical protein
MARLLDWNGKDLPQELRELPAGRYVVEEYDEELATLTDEQEAGLRQAIASVKAGRSRPAAAVHKRLRAIVTKRR